MSGRNSINHLYAIDLIMTTAPRKHESTSLCAGTIYFSAVAQALAPTVRMSAETGFAARHRQHPLPSAATLGTGHITSGEPFPISDPT